MDNTKNADYWRMRRARQMYLYMEDAEMTAYYIRQGYLDATEHLKNKAEHIFEKYRLKHGLTRAEAETLLKQIRTPQDIETLKKLLAQDPKNADLLKELEAGAYGNRLDTLANTLAQIDTVMLPIVTATLTAGASLYKDLAEKAYYEGLFDLQQYAGYGWNVKTLSKKNIERVLNTKWAGRDFSSSVWANAQATAEALKKELLVNLLSGRTLFDATRAIQARLGASYNNARRIIRTESCYICNEMHAQGYKDAGLDEYMYVAILDLRTSQICQSLDKKVFKLSDKQVGVNYPPMHPYCRSTTIAYFGREVLMKMKQKAIDPNTGKRVMVPASMTYAEWYNAFVKGAKDSD